MKIWRYKIDFTLWSKTSCDLFLLPAILIYHRNFTLAWGRCYWNFMYQEPVRDTTVTAFVWCEDCYEEIDFEKIKDGPNGELLCWRCLKTRESQDLRERVQDRQEQK